MDTFIEKCDDYFYIKTSGIVDNFILKDTLNDVFNRCNSCGFSKILVDFLDLNFSSVSKTNRILFAINVKDIFNFNKKIKIACLIENKHMDGTAKDYIEGIKFEGFQNKDEALQWLKK